VYYTPWLNVCANLRKVNDIELLDDDFALPQVDRVANFTPPGVDHGPERDKAAISFASHVGGCGRQDRGLEADALGLSLH